ncbi:molybdopterin-dependent oxidoreductase [bacterium]|nr:molybdopterin-dependent oxidoreductase [bacterium]
MADQTVHPSLKPGTEDIRFFLNDREVVGKKGETIITVAAREGVYIPHYCWHPSLSVAGNCRLCLVEVHLPDPRNPDAPAKPAPKPVIGCQTPISNGLRVYTESKVAQECQQGMMEFLLVNHPLDCPICDRGGECQLQRYSMEYGAGHTRMADEKRKFHKPQADPLIDIERNRCIMCTRCVRFNDEVGGEHVMGVFDRGEGNYIGTFGQGPVSNILSGNIIDICPVGCLTSRPFRFKARVWELAQTQSTSIWDASGAKVTHWTRNRKLMRTTPPSRKAHDRYTVNEDTEEFIDNITRFGSDFGLHADRWDESRIRIGGTLIPGAFVEAVRQAAGSLAKTKVNHGADSIAVLVSPRATMEEGFLAAKFARTVIGNDNVDWRMSFATAASADAASLAFQHADGDLNDGFSAVVLVNGDYLHQVPTFAMRVKEYARLNNKPVIMIGHHHDAYFSKCAGRRQYGCRPAETSRALELLSLAIKGDAAGNGELAKIFSVAESEVASLVDLLKGVAGKALLIQSLEDMNGAYLPSEVPAALTLKAALGATWKYIPVLRDRNAFGLYAVGAQPGRLPGSEEAVRKAWKINEKAQIPTAGGQHARDLVAAIEEGRIKGLLALGADVLYSYPDQDRLLAALEKLETFVVSDLFNSEITRRATVFFAAASNLERDGVMADLEGNLARLKDVDGPTGGARPDWETLTGIATMMGSTAFAYESVEDVFNEMIRLVAPGFRGSFTGLELAGPANDHSVQDPGGARRRTPAYNPGDYRVDGAHLRWSSEPFAGAIPAVAAEAPAAAGQFLLTWGEHVQGDDYHLNHASIAHLLKAKPYVEVHPADAATLALEDGKRAVLTVGTESIEVTARVRKGPAQGTLYFPAGLGGLKLTGLGESLTAGLQPALETELASV